MLTGNCAVCNTPMNVTTMRICSESKMTGDHVTDGCIRICRKCKPLMTINLDAFNLDSQQGNAPLKEIVSEFIHVFTTEAWTGVKPPTYNQLAIALNEAGIMSPTGQLWQYSNLMQFMLRCNIQRGKPKAYVTHRNDVSLVQARERAMNMHINEIEGVPEAAPPSETLIDELAAASVMPSGFPGM